jgi:uncharacterized protein YkwD
MPYRKTARVGLVVSVLVAGTASEAVADDIRRRDRMLRLLNTTRRAHGKPVLRLNKELSRYAFQHSKQMAGRHRLFHTVDLYSKVRAYGPSRWGENVGAARWLKKVHKMFMNSSAHRRNILNGGFRRVGIGAIKVGRYVWVTTIFYGG